MFLVAYGIDWQGENTHAQWSQVKFQIPSSWSRNGHPGREQMRGPAAFSDMLPAGMESVELHTLEPRGSVLAALHSFTLRASLTIREASVVLGTIYKVKISRSFRWAHFWQDCMCIGVEREETQISISNFSSQHLESAFSSPPPPER